MQTHLIALRRGLVGLAFGLLLSSAGCGAPDLGESDGEEIGSAPQADISVVVSAPHPGLDPMCAGDGVARTFHNPGYPLHESGVCVGEGYTFSDAHAFCGSDVK